MKQTIRTLSLSVVVIAVAASASAAKPSVVRDTQMHLANLGYYTGPVNGRMGAQTTSAIKNFQSANGLHATGKMDPQTSQMMSQAETYYMGAAVPGNYYPAAQQTMYQQVTPVAYHPVPVSGTYQPVVVAQGAAVAAQPQPVAHGHGYYRSTYQPVAYSANVVAAPQASAPVVVANWGFQN